MSRKGHYNGGNTRIHPGNTSWFGTPKGPVKPQKRRRRSLTEIAYADYRAKGLGSDTELLKSDDPRALRKPWRRKKKRSSPT
jgi:hypothetical protein